MPGCSTADVVAAVRTACATIAEHRIELTDLDRPIGDGDHGENLARGFGAVNAKLEQPPETPAGVLKLVAATLLSTVGGASGPLFGTAFLRAATAAGDSAVLDGPVVARLLRAALDGVVARGKAQPGEKTMVDALTPAVEAADRVGDASVAEVLQAAARAAADGASATVPLLARKGRASYLGERSIGYRDPGATSVAYLLAAFAESAARP